MIFEFCSHKLMFFYIVHYVQYKFCVDGEWRHDEHQPFISSEYGIVNTVLLATEPNFMHGINQGMPSGSNMDVDNEAFQRLVRVSYTLIINILIAWISVLIIFSCIWLIF